MNRGFPYLGLADVGRNCHIKTWKRVSLLPRQQIRMSNAAFLPRPELEIPRSCLAVMPSIFLSKQAGRHFKDHQGKYSLIGLREARHRRVPLSFSSQDSGLGLSFLKSCSHASRMRLRIPSQGNSTLQAPNPLAVHQKL